MDRLMRLGGSLPVSHRQDADSAVTMDRLMRWFSNSIAMPRDWISKLLLVFGTLG